MFLLVSNLTGVCGVWLKHSYDIIAKSRIQARMPGCQDVWASPSSTTICLFLLVELWDLTFVGVLFLWVLFLLLLFVGGFLPFETHSPEYT